MVPNPMNKCDDLGVFPPPIFGSTSHMGCLKLLSFHEFFTNSLGFPPFLLGFPNWQHRSKIVLQSRVKPAPDLTIWGPVDWVVEGG